MSIYCFAIIVVLMMFFSYKTYLISKNDDIAGDCYTYHLIAQQMEVMRNIPQYLTCYIIDRNNKYIFDYPPLFIYLFSKLSKNIRDNKFKYINSCLDIINLLFTAILFYCIFNDTLKAVFASVLVYFTPIIQRSGLDFTGRVFANILYNGIMLSFICWILYTNYIFLIMIFLLGYIFLLSHKFELQSFLILGISYSIFLQYFDFIIFIIILLLTAYAFLKKYRIILKGHLRFLKDCYFHYNPFLKKEIKKKDFLKLFLYNPMIFLIYYLYYLNDDLFYKNLLSVISISSITVLLIIAFLVVFIKKLNFIGAGERYLEQTSIFTAYLIIENYYFINQYLLNIFLTLEVLTCILVINKFYKNIFQKENKEILEMCEFLKTIDRDNIFCKISKTGYGNFIAYNTEKCLLSDLSSCGFRDTLDIMFEKISINEIIKKYNINILIIDDDYKLNSDITCTLSAAYIGEKYKVFLMEK